MGDPAHLFSIYLFGVIAWGLTCVYVFVISHMSLWLLQCLEVRGQARMMILGTYLKLAVNDLELQD